MAFSKAAGAGATETYGEYVAGRRQPENAARGHFQQPACYICMRWMSSYADTNLFRTCIIN
jgi:hypothetical protein